MANILRNKKSKNTRKILAPYASPQPNTAAHFFRAVVWAVVLQTLSASWELSSSWLLTQLITKYRDVQGTSPLLDSMRSQLKLFCKQEARVTTDELCDKWWLPDFKVNAVTMNLHFHGILTGLMKYFVEFAQNFHRKLWKTSISLVLVQMSTLTVAFFDWVSRTRHISWRFRTNLFVLNYTWWI